MSPPNVSSPTEDIRKACWHSSGALDREAGLPSQLGPLSMTLNLDKSLRMCTCHTTGAQWWRFPDSLRESRGSRRQSISHKPIVKGELYDLLRRDLELLN